MWRRNKRKTIYTGVCMVFIFIYANTRQMQSTLTIVYTCVYATESERISFIAHSCKNEINWFGECNFMALCALKEWKCMVEKHKSTAVATLHDICVQQSRSRCGTNTSIFIQAIIDFDIIFYETQLEFSFSLSSYFNQGFSSFNFHKFTFFSSS